MRSIECNVIQGVFGRISVEFTLISYRDPLNKIHKSIIREYYKALPSPPPILFHALLSLDSPQQYFHPGAAEQSPICCLAAFHASDTLYIQV